MCAGEASMLSIVPRSHSRDTISAVSSVPVIVITMRDHARHDEIRRLQLRD